MKFLFLFIILFFYILAPRINFFVPINTGVISALIFFFYSYKASLKSFKIKENIYFISFLLFLICYHFAFAMFYGNNSTYFISILASLVVYTLFSFTLSAQLYSSEYNSLNIVKLIKIVVCIIFANSLIIILEFQYPPFKDLIESYLVNEVSSNISYAEHPFRLRGFSSSGGAGLSIINAASVWFCAVLAKRRQINKSLALLFILVITLSNLFTGRTGLVYSIVFSIYFLIFVYFSRLNSNKLSIFRDIVIILIGISFMPEFELNDEIISWAFEWTKGFETGSFSSASTDELNEMLFIPTDNIFNLFLGIGFFEGVNDFYPRTDSGYLKTLLSVGLIFAILFYAIIFYKFFKITLRYKNLRLYIYPILILILISEVKEPFIYQNFLSRVIFLIIGMDIYLGYKEKIKSNGITYYNLS